MKRITLILMAVFILIGTFNEGVVYLSFKINQDYISNFLCVEKDIPESTCHGKCQLTKTIIENHEQDKNSKKPFLTKNKQQTFYLIFKNRNHPKSRLIFQKNEILIASQQVVGNHYNSDIFHPPKI